VGNGLWCLTSLLTLFQLYRGVSFIGVETGVPGENHRPVSKVTDKLYHIMLYRVHLSMCGIRTHNISYKRTSKRQNKPSGPPKATRFFLLFFFINTIFYGIARKWRFIDQEKIEDTNGIRSRKLKEDKQYNRQNKRTKRQKMVDIIPDTTQKIKD
jgi:hypothetical protein